MAIAAPTQLATVNLNTPGKTTWVTASITFPAGSLGVVSFGTSGSAVNAAYAVTDSAGNTWAVRGEANANGGSTGSHSMNAEHYFASSTTCTVTITYPSSNMQIGWCGYTTGTDTVPFDAVGSNGQISAVTSNTVTTSTTLTTNAEIGFVSFHVASNATGPTTWPTAGWTSLFVGNDPTRSRTGAMEYQIPAAGSGSTLSSGAISYTTSQVSAASIATYKPAAAGAAAISMLATLGVG